MRFVQIDEQGKIVGHGTADAEHFDAAVGRGERLIGIPDDAPYQFDGLRVDLTTGQIVEEKQNDA